ncbi:hypothetical protein ABZ896_44595 [Streptomyces sp. NPDC047072]|uniref:hypothetical protein n=1 Tax=Streptomyces sp. NPDC047072 TaxID=3154809 RepID=UPI0033C3918D
MRGLPVRRVAASVLCGALLIGLAGPAAVAADNDSARHVRTAAKAPLPGADGLLGQVKALGDLGTVLTPVTDLLNAVLKADGGQLSPEEATKLVDAVKSAIAKVTAAAPAAPVTPPAALPVTPPATTLPATPNAADPTSALPTGGLPTSSLPTSALPTSSLPTSALPTSALPTSALPTSALPTSALPTSALPTSSLPALPGVARVGDDSKARAALPADLVADALAALQKAVETLLTAVTSGDPTKVVPAVTGVLTGLVNVLAATLLSGGLPAPSLAGLPPLPSLPVSPPSLPVSPPAVGGLLPTS